MTGYRRVDITTNSLQYLDDSNMLQYGLFNADDMRDFLIKLSNFDFRQSNRVRTFICYCPPSYGLLTVSWFHQISSQLDMTAPIFQIYCKDYPNLVYVFDFPCDNANIVSANNGNKWARVNSSTTTTNTTTPVLLPSSSYLVTHQMIKNFAAEIVDVRADGDNNTSSSMLASSDVAAQSAANNNNLYYLFFLLLIPIVLVFVLFFICCCGRCCQVNTVHSCNLLICPCMRPNDRSLFSGRKCFNHC